MNNYGRFIVDRVRIINAIADIIFVDKKILNIVTQCIVAVSNITNADARILNVVTKSVIVVFNIILVDKGILNVHIKNIHQYAHFTFKNERRLFDFRKCIY